MNLFVLLKQVPDTATKIKVSGSAIDESGVKWIVSPFDENAIEAAIQIREKSGGTITAVSLGSDRVVDSLRTALAMGVDRIVHLKDDDYNVYDSGYTGYVLAAYLKEQGADIIFAGQSAIDSQSSMVPGMVGEILGCASINNALEISIEGDQVSVLREVQGGNAKMKSAMPVVISATKKLNEPRYPSIKGSMMVKKKKPEVVEVSAYNNGVPKIEVSGMELPPPRPEGRIIEGDSVEAKVQELVKLMKEEARVI